MKNLLATLIVASIVLATTHAAASSEFQDFPVMLSAVPLDSVVGDRTVTIGADSDPTPDVDVDFRTSPKRGVAMFRTLALFVDYTHTTDGTLTVTVTVGRTVATAKFAPGFCTEAALGPCTSAAGGVFNMAVTADLDEALRANIRSFQAIKIVVSHSAPVAGDVVSLSGYITK